VKKIALISILLLILIFGCGQKNDDPLGPYPIDEEGIIARFIEQGWIAYLSGDFELAYARFDSAVKMDASNSQAYVGVGFSNMQLGSEDEVRFDMAISSFGFVSTLEGGSPIEMAYDPIYWGFITPDSALFGLGVDPDNTPIMGVLDPAVQFIPGPLAPGEVEEQDLQVMRITDNTIVTVPTTDTFGNFYMPQAGDLFLSNYAYFDGDISRTLALSFAGMAQTAQILGRLDSEYYEIVITGAPNEWVIEPSDVLLNAMIYAKAVLFLYGEEGSLRADTTEIPEYIDPAITSRNVRLLLAQSYFDYGYLYNCMWELWRLDPSLIDYFDPESPTFERDLQEKMEDLLQ